MPPRRTFPAYVARQAEAAVRKLAATSPIVAITGPRQSGKTTLAVNAFPDFKYANLEEPDTRLLASRDPRSFLAGLGGGAIIDEAQRVPDLFSYLQVHTDAHRPSAQFVLTGSSQFLLNEQITQSLAGRVAYIHLLPFSWHELTASGAPPASLEDALFRGAFPPVHARGADPAQWYRDYVATYVERDVRQLIRVLDIDAFQQFVRLCAHWTGQLLNLTRMAADCGVSANTAKAWLGVLRASYIVYLLHPHHANFRKRLVKSPKLYFLDTGMAAQLLSIRQADDLRAHAMRGPLFESWLIAELLKGRFNRGLADNLYFWRSRGGDEIDVLADHGRTLQPIECKSGRTIAGDWFDGIEKWSQWAGRKAEVGRLVYGGDRAAEHRGIKVLPWKNIDSLTAVV
jgi:hypothetical protein